MVSVQPDSNGTVPSEATFSSGALWSCVPQSVQPVTDGRRPGSMPNTSKPLSPRGLELDRLVAVIRTHRATTGLSRSMVTTPPFPDVVRCTLVQDRLSRDVS